jgi:hypothetical protein
MKAASIILIGTGLFTSAPVFANEITVPEVSELVATQDADERIGASLRSLVQRPKTTYSVQPFEADNDGLLDRQRLSEARLTSTYQHNEAQWQDRDSVGLLLQRGRTNIGVWGDVREVNVITNDDQRLLPGQLRARVVPDAVAVSDAPVVATKDAPAADRKVVAPTAISAVSTTGDVAGVRGSNFSAASINTVSTGNAQARATAGSDLSYKEYIGGLFMSQSF